MKWTVWQRRSRCENCGAKIHVPDEGLYVTCEYCGTKGPVPDFEARRQAMDRQEREVRRQSKAQVRHDRQRAEVRSTRTRSWGAWKIILLVWVILGFSFWQSGLLQTWIVRLGLRALVTEVGTKQSPAQQVDDNRAAQQYVPAARKAQRKKPKRTTRRPKKKRPARKPAATTPTEGKPARAGPTPYELNEPPPSEAPAGAGPGFEVPETDLDRALEDDDL
jgi:hypothetical protein